MNDSVALHHGNVGLNNLQLQDDNNDKQATTWWWKHSENIRPVKIICDDGEKHTIKKNGKKTLKWALSLAEETGDEEAEGHDEELN